MRTKFVADTLKVAQVPIHALSADTVKQLRQLASFVDTDKTLNEFFVSVDAINEIANDKTINSKEINGLLSEVKNFHYVHLLAI
jgi:archaellum biogenesis ATPase FlaH